MSSPTNDSAKKHFYRVPRNLADMTDEERLEFCRQLWEQMVGDLRTSEQPKNASKS